MKPRTQRLRSSAQQGGATVIEVVLAIALAAVIVMIITIQVVDSGSLKMPTLG